MTDHPTAIQPFDHMPMAERLDRIEEAAKQHVADAADILQRQRQNRGGRKPAADPRAHRVTVRFTAAERATLADMAGAGDVGDYIRRTVLGQRVRSRVTVPAVNGTAWTALAGMLANLNQIARLANTGQIAPDLAPTLDDLREHVVAMRSELLGQGEP